MPAKALGRVWWQDGERKMAGAWGLTGCWSFYPFKILGGYGDGGAITTNDPDVALFATQDALQW